MRSIARSTVFLFSIFLEGPEFLYQTSPMPVAVCVEIAEGCTCAGTYPCGWCAMPVPTDLQITAAFSDRPSNETVVDEEFVSPACNSIS